MSWGGPHEPCHGITPQTSGRSGASRRWCHPPNNSPGAAVGPNPEEVRRQEGLRLVRARSKTVECWRAKQYRCI
jgi:hypothetical protein